MHQIKIHKDAENDLKEISTDHPIEAAKSRAILQEAKTNPAVQDALLDHGFGDQKDEDFSVQRWQEFWRQRYNLWRLKVWACDRYYPQYRVIYAYDPQYQTFYILGVLNRDWDYRTDHERTQRIIDIYEGLDIRIY